MTVSDVLSIIDMDLHDDGFILNIVTFGSNKKIFKGLINNWDDYDEANRAYGHIKVCAMKWDNCYLELIEEFK